MPPPSHRRTPGVRTIPRASPRGSHPHRAPACARARTLQERHDLRGFVVAVVARVALEQVVATSAQVTAAR
jgi:hypothetical protein